MGFISQTVDRWFGVSQNPQPQATVTPPPPPVAPPAAQSPTIASGGVAAASAEAQAAARGLYGAGFNGTEERSSSEIPGKIDLAAGSLGGTNPSTPTMAGAK